MKIAVNTFALRQTPESAYSHFDGGWEKLVGLVEENFDRGKQGYKEGVLLVPLPPEGFWSSTVPVGPETLLRPVFSARRDGEAKYLEVRTVGQKSPAQFVFVVLYSKAVLGEEATTDAEWEVVSVNARETEEEEPMDPMTMARNFLVLPGGTKGDFSAEQFARSIVYWSTRVKVDAAPKEIKLTVEEAMEEVARCHAALTEIYSDLCFLETSHESVEQARLCPTDLTKFWKQPEWQERFPIPYDMTERKQERQARVEALLAWMERTGRDTGPLRNLLWVPEEE